MAFICDTFVNAGWVLSDTKCIFNINVTNVVLLGFLIDTVPVLTGALICFPRARPNYWTC